MAAGSTYTPIATQTLGSAAASVTFSSISGAYTDLVLLSVAGTTTGAPNTFLQFNGDTGANYSVRALIGNGSTASQGAVNNSNQFYIDYNAMPDQTLGTTVNICNIMNYANATTYKTILVRANAAARGTEAIAGIWRSTAAVTSLVVKPASSTFLAGSTFTLYGIQSA
jgi:hypothetical protein